jgi:polysaccharide export outer membrane protein
MPCRQRHSSLLPASLLLLLCITGCATAYRDLPAGTHLTVTAGQSTSAIVERQIETIPSLAPAPPPPADYLIGCGDLLSVTIYGHPELGTAASGAGATGGVAAAAATTRSAGSRVDENGNLRLPLVGSVAIAGLSQAKAEEKLSVAYKALLKEPWVTVEVVEHHSRPLFFFGSFRKPGVVYMDRPMTLLQGIALAEVDTAASLRSARLSRSGKVQPVDIYELLANGDQRQNVWLQAGDAIYLPDKSAQQIFIFGAVKKAGPMPLTGPLSLAQALAAADPNIVGSDMLRVRIIRSLSPTKGELLVVDFDKVMRGEAVPIMMTAGDIVYLPRTPLGTWNDTINEILPSLQACSALMQPFVTIKYLSD